MSCDLKDYHASHMRGFWYTAAFLSVLYSGIAYFELYGRTMHSSYYEEVYEMERKWPSLHPLVKECLADGHLCSRDYSRIEAAYKKEIAFNLVED